jgi:hypothetical protein
MARLLIAAGGAAEGAGDVPATVRALIDAADEVLVIAPRLPSRLEWLVSDTDKAASEADERLQTVLGQLEELGVEASGDVGADDPLLAFDDAVRKFSPDHILVALREAERAGWQERGLLEQIEQRCGLPLTVFSLKS